MLSVAEPRAATGRFRSDRFGSTLLSQVTALISTHNRFANLTLPCPKRRTASMRRRGGPSASAAYCSASRMSSGARSGRQARTSCRVVPSATMLTTTATGRGSRRMQGFRLNAAIPVKQPPARRAATPHHGRKKRRGVHYTRPVPSTRSSARREAARVTEAGWPRGPRRCPRGLPSGRAESRSRSRPPRAAWRDCSVTRSPRRSRPG